jgi:hypothetical protein
MRCINEIVYDIVGKALIARSAGKILDGAGHPGAWLCLRLVSERTRRKD